MDRYTATLALIADLGKSYAAVEQIERWGLYRADPGVWEAYKALWWYGAPRFQDRPAEYPAVSEINARLDRSERA